jgi:hypothetical protein
MLGRLLVETDRLSVLDRLERWIEASARSGGDNEAGHGKSQAEPSEEWHQLLLDCQVLAATDGEDNSSLAVQLHRFLSEEPTIAHATSVLL